MNVIINAHSLAVYVAASQIVVYAILTISHYYEIISEHVSKRKQVHWFRPCWAATFVTQCFQHFSSSDYLRRTV